MLLLLLLLLLLLEMEKALMASCRPWQKILGDYYKYVVLCVVLLDLPTLFT